MTDFEALIRASAPPTSGSCSSAGLPAPLLGSPRTKVDLIYARDEENLARLSTALEAPRMGTQPHRGGRAPGTPPSRFSTRAARSAGIEAPGISQRLADRRVQPFRQMIDEVG